MTESGRNYIQNQDRPTTINEIKEGDILSNKELYQLFKCGNTGGMRLSTKTNTLCLISDHTKSIYADKWVGDEIHYTGIGTTGDQSIDFRQNKTLNHSRENGVILHFFEVFRKNNYEYKGEVELSGNPYNEIQIGEDGKPRSVFIFPLKFKSNFQSSITTQRNLDELDYIQQKKLKKLSDEQIKTYAENSPLNPSYRATISNQFIRNPHVKEHAKRSAKGFCQLCGNPAPFNNSDGTPYLEIHHIIWLSRKGEDSIENTTALCPNCHRKMHILDLKEDILKLQSMKK